MITYYIIKKDLLKGFEALLVYPMALDFFIICFILFGLFKLVMLFIS